MRKLVVILLITASGIYGVQHLLAQAVVEGRSLKISINDAFFDVQVGVDREINNALTFIEDEWDPSFIPFALDTLYLLKDAHVFAKLENILTRKTGQAFGADIFAWWQWVWAQPENRHPEYADFKSRLYGLIHFPFKNYFAGKRETAIRLDEIVWGGVRQDGIPPLRYPKMISAGAANYLKDDNIVFGIAIGDDARAYPKRVLAWHEMFVDEVGGKSVAGVY